MRNVCVSGLLVLLVAPPLAWAADTQRPAAGAAENNLRSWEIVWALQRYGIRTRQDPWTLDELELVYQVVQDFAAKLMDGQAGDAAARFRTTVGPVVLRRVHDKEAIDKIYAAIFGRAKSWSIFGTVTLYDRALNDDMLEVKATIVHELAHAWDWHTLGRASMRLNRNVGQEVKPSAYADRGFLSEEHWAETVASWVYPGYSLAAGRELGPRHLAYVESVAHVRSRPQDQGGQELAAR
jgi:hypothetical protein